jgi:hypothetical protein
LRQVGVCVLESAPGRHQVDPFLEPIRHRHREVVEFVLGFNL